MKKLVLCIVAVAAFAACKKESTPLSPVSSQNLTMDQQVRNLIQKADKGLYDRCYNEKGPIVTVKSIPGAFIILGGDVASGTCFPTNGVCFTIISIAKSVTDTTGLAQYSVVTTDFDESYGSNVTANLVINSSPTPTVTQITQISARFDNRGGSTFSYKQ